MLLLLLSTFFSFFFSFFELLLWNFYIAPVYCAMWISGDQRNENQPKGWHKTKQNEHFEAIINAQHNNKRSDQNRMRNTEQKAMKNTENGVEKKIALIKIQKWIKCIKIHFYDAISIFMLHLYSQSRCADVEFLFSICFVWNKTKWRWCWYSDNTNTKLYIFALCFFQSHFLYSLHRNF